MLKTSLIKRKAKYICKKCPGGNCFCRGISVWPSILKAEPEITSVSSPFSGGWYEGNPSPTYHDYPQCLLITLSLWVEKNHSARIVNNPFSTASRLSIHRRRRSDGDLSLLQMPAFPARTYSMATPIRRATAKERRRVARGPSPHAFDAALRKQVTKLPDRGFPHFTSEGFLHPGGLASCEADRYKDCNKSGYSFHFLYFFLYLPFLQYTRNMGQ